MSERTLTILVTSDEYLTPGLRRRVADLAPHARLIGPADVEAEAALAAQVEIVLGRPRPEFFPRATALRWVQTTFAGMEWAHAPQVQAHPAVLTNARIHATSISEHLFGLLLMLGRKLYRHGPGRTQWQGPPLEQVHSLPGKTLCILGLGVIGQQCAVLGRAFGMRVIAVRRTPRPADGIDAVYGQTQLHAALEQADVIMNILPAGPDTKKLIGAAQFKAMRDGVYFLNAGRGSTVDTDALVAALRCGKVGAAGLDVVDPEPLPPEHPLWHMDNVVVTPHYGGSFAGYIERASEVFLDNLKRYLAGKPLQWVVDKQLGY